MGKQTQEATHAAAASAWAAVPEALAALPDLGGRAGEHPQSMRLKHHVGIPFSSARFLLNNGERELFFCVGELGKGERML